MKFVKREEKFKNLALEYGLDPLVVDMMLYKLDRMGFFKAPASTKYHGNYEGGLFDHSLAVTESLIELTNKLELEWWNSSSPFIVGMFHDLCKCDCYRKDADGWHHEETTIPGHGDKSVIKAFQIFPGLNDEEIHCIRWHMGAYEKDPSMWNIYGKAIEKYPNVLWTHTADMMAARIRGI